MPHLVASMFPDLFLICVMRDFFFLVLMLAADLIPLYLQEYSVLSDVFRIFCCL